MSISEIIHESISIEAPAAKVWDALTHPELIPQWISDLEVQVLSDWETGSSITFHGVHDGHPYTDHGTILQFEPYSLFEYNYLSSFSKLTDEPGNYAVISFQLREDRGHTILDITVTNCVTDAIFQHLRFYWSITPSILKRFAEAL
jgi:uncharacterized protein YndB with AHSA1/START domain